MLQTLLWMALAACGDKEPTSTVAPAEAKAPKGGSVSSAPSDATSQAFAASLVALDVTDFHPSDSTGGQIVYAKLDFLDGTWNAQGYVEADFEKIDCTENGTWTMEPATSPTTATITWKLDQTDCAGREAGTETRVELTITPDGKLDTKFR